MSVDHEKLDQIDQRILRALSTNARLSMVALGEQVGLSKTPVTVRVRRLEEAGYIKGYRAVLDASRLGLEHVAFMVLNPFGYTGCETGPQQIGARVDHQLAGVGNPQ